MSIPISDPFAEGLHLASSYRQAWEAFDLNPEHQSHMVWLRAKRALLAHLAEHEPIYDFAASRCYEVTPKGQLLVSRLTVKIHA